MTFLKWILLLVCVALVLRPLLARRENRNSREGTES